VPFSQRDLDETHPPLESQIVRPRMRSQALGRTPDDDDDGRSWLASAEDGRARPFRDGTDAEKEEDVTVDCAGREGQSVAS
jgi:hypothetical protein